MSCRSSPASAGKFFRLGRILRRNSEEVRQDIEAQKEFELLGAQVAVPILDRETAIGVAVFDGRITGEPLINSELELVFHLLEQLGMAIKNIWLHDQLAGNHEMMADILRELSSACIVVNRDLAILHANKTARRIFAGKLERRSANSNSAICRTVLGSKIYQVLKTGSAIANFRYEPEDASGTIYNISVVPFQRQAGGLPNSALLMAEDLTQSEQLQKLEIEAANLRLVKSMAYRLANEVGNALVPLTVHQQLLPEKWKDPKFWVSLEGAMAESLKRVTRLLSQMRFLAREGLLSEESFPLAPLIEEAYKEACSYVPDKDKPPQLKCEPSGKGLVATGDRPALKHALAEVMLNALQAALQANPSDPEVGRPPHARCQERRQAGAGGRSAGQWQWFSRPMPSARLPNRSSPPAMSGWGLDSPSAARSSRRTGESWKSNPANPVSCAFHCPLSGRGFEAGRLTARFDFSTAAKMGGATFPGDLSGQKIPGIW